MGPFAAWSWLYFWHFCFLLSKKSKYYTPFFISCQTPLSLAATLTTLLVTQKKLCYFLCHIRSVENQRFFGEPGLIWLGHLSLQTYRLLLTLLCSKDVKDISSFSMNHILLGARWWCRYLHNIMWTPSLTSVICLPYDWCNFSFWE